MTPVELHVERLKSRLSTQTPETSVDVRTLPSGAQLILVRDYHLVEGWNRELTSIAFLAPVGYPGAQPDCFWVIPAGFRLANGSVPQASNDSNPVPEAPDIQGTWFSWHVQYWNPNSDSLSTYFSVIEKRLELLQ